ncbi:hypothetical protein [Burkholderia lata]|uniref:hypothetical protein n=1 Tax=Burkholderia lata (strain ATCC 17760 / DSM 23089 / LMG 22485 / NCIMB 9086 / R18194 / 383) TaxID=482957 RepID=UPI00158314C0|nr:hypothetical protein [Burkholderia lata]
MKTLPACGAGWPTMCAAFPGLPRRPFFEEGCATPAPFPACIPPGSHALAAHFLTSIKKAALIGMRKRVQRMHPA